MKAVAIAVILLVLAAVVLWLGDNFLTSGTGGLFGYQAALLMLLLCIPLSLSLFFFLSLRGQEKDSRHRREDDSSQ
jgi:hypothetical protein